MNVTVEERKHASDEVKTYCEDKYKELEDKLLYAEVYQRRENLRFYDIEEKSGEKEDTVTVLNKNKHCTSRRRTSNACTEWENRGNGKPRAIIARFLRCQDREFIFSKSSALKGSEFGTSADLPREIVKRRKDQSKKLEEARKDGKLAFFSRAEPDKLYIDGSLVPL